MEDALLKHRSITKEKKPDFIRQDAALKRLRKKWKRPRGLDSKRRLRKDGHQRRPSRGYSSPNKVKGLTKEGLQEKIITTSYDLDNLKSNEIAVISRRLGAKKKLIILKKAIDKKIMVSNINPEEFIKKQEEKIAEKKKKKPAEKVTVEKKKVEPTKEEHKTEKKKIMEKKITTKAEY